MPNEELTDVTAKQQQNEVADLAPASGSAALSIWNDSRLMKQAFSAAKYFASSAIAPEPLYRNHPENCLIAIDIANRMGVSPLPVMQNLYIVKGKPCWAGSFCIAAINSCGRFTPLEFVTDEDGTTYAKATRKATGAVCCGTPITWDMVKNEGWLDKQGSKWKTMPQQMFMYRAATFFARVYCPDVLMGLQTKDEVEDVYGYEPAAPSVTVISLDDA